MAHLNLIAVFISGLLLASLPTSARADYECYGVLVTGAGVDVDGGVFVTLQGTIKGRHLGVCDLNEVSNGVEPEACRGLFALLHSARLSNRPLMITMKDNQNVAACPKELLLPSWSPLSFIYMELLGS